jgi:spore photoproduct lyase
MTWLDAAMRFPIEEIWIDEEAQDEPLTREILRRVGSARVLVGQAAVDASKQLQLEPDPLTRGKKILRLVKQKGAFVKPCPGTPQYVCCGLQILHIGQGCPMDCRYCALQVYFNRPTLEVFVNTDDLLGQLEGLLKIRHGSTATTHWNNAALGETALRSASAFGQVSEPPRPVRGFEEGARERLLVKRPFPERFSEQNRPRFVRLCTGEFTDSLALEPLTGLAARLVSLFAEQTRASLELKTKTDFIDPLLDVNPRGRVVVGVSVNSPRIAAHEEQRAAALERRLTAAARVQNRGYRIAFHFDPVIPVQDWQEDYSQTITEIFRLIDPSALAWISLGVIRFVPALRERALSRFGPVQYLHDEFTRGLDGKMRLPVQRRIGIYRLMAEKIREHAPLARIYLCMESPYVWEKALGMKMASDQDLTLYLDGAMAGG